jgi:hypothetical protein
LLRSTTKNNLRKPVDFFDESGEVSTRGNYDLETHENFSNGENILLGFNLAVVQRLFRELCPWD